MSLDFFVGEMQAQANEASRMASEANQAVSLMQQSIHQFLSAPLSSKTYDTAKRYFSVAYLPLGQSVIMVGESLTTAHQRMISDFQGMVGGCDIQEEILKNQIQQWEQLKYQLSLQIDQAKEWKPDLERRYMNACNTVDRIQERLEKLYAYNAHSASIFSEFYASLGELDAGLSAIETSGAWNPSTGTFNINRLNMTWAKPIQERWARREQQIKAAKDKEVKKALGKLDGYTIVCTNLGSTKEWYLMKNGKILPPNEYSSLYKQLEQFKDYLPKNRYTVKEMMVMKNEMPLSPVFGGGILGNIGKIGKGVEIINKGLGIVKVGQSVIDQIKSAPNINYMKEDSDFKDKVKNGEKLKDHSIVEDDEANNLPSKGQPNSSTDLLNPDGSVKQRRYYGKDGKAVEDIDFNHTDDGTHEFPHRHKWDWKKKNPRQK
ncbi:hypothetical protein [Enterococcus rivorum]|nr:hypothetical protein [Enterococcus rivorum]MBP2099022.1 hypothetical protein [Enterococcus rivorum]